MPTLKGPTIRRCPYCHTRIDIAGMLTNEHGVCRCGGRYQLVWRSAQGRASLVKRPAEPERRP